MVDPNRKINRLSDDDAAFLVECEHEFRNRYTETDEEFAAFVAKPTKPPPVVEPWQTKRHHGESGGGNWNRNNYRSNNRNHQGNHYYNRNNDNRSQRNYRQQYNRPYDRNYRRDGDYSGGSGGGGYGHGSSHSY